VASPHGDRRTWPAVNAGLGVEDHPEPGPNELLQLACQLLALAQLGLIHALARSMLAPLDDTQRRRLVAAVGEVQRLLTATLVEIAAVDPADHGAHLGEAPDAPSVGP
jgi:hypothetical protein